MVVIGWAGEEGREREGGGDVGMFSLFGVEVTHGIRLTWRAACGKRKKDGDGIKPAPAVCVAGTPPSLPSLLFFASADLYL